MLGDFAQQEILNWLACSRQVPVLPGGSIPTIASGDFTNVGVWMALFTTAPTSDAGTGGTEVTTVATNYARQQVGGVLTTNGTTAAGNAVLHFASVPSWILGPSGTGVVGMQIRDLTTPASIPANTTLVSATATTVTMSANAAGAGVGATDIISFSAFGPATASSGNPEPNTQPGSITNAGIVTFNQSTGSWGTVTSWALYDAATSGNFHLWDYLGLFNWIPFSCSNGTPGVFTTDAAADVPVNGSSVVVTQKFGGTLPTTAGSFAGLLTTAGASTNTFNVGVNTTSVGGGQFRQVGSQLIGTSTTPSFAVGQLKATAA
jgi:hypothetical protein